VAKVSLPNWATGASQVIVSRGIGVYFAVTGNGGLQLYSFGLFNKSSTAATGFTNGSEHWIRATRASATGLIKFYTSTDGINWTQLGTNISDSPGAMSDGGQNFDYGVNTFFRRLLSHDSQACPDPNDDRRSSRCRCQFRKSTRGCGNVCREEAQVPGGYDPQHRPFEFLSLDRKNPHGDSAGDLATGTYQGFAPTAAYYSLDGVIDGASILLTGFAINPGAKTWSATVPSSAPEGDYTTILTDSVYSPPTSSTVYVSQPRPDSGGNAAIPYRIKYGAANMMFAGDSTTPTVAGTTLDAITSTWPYAKIRGFIADGFNGITYSNWGSSSYGGINGSHDGLTNLRGLGWKWKWRDPGLTRSLSALEHRQRIIHWIDHSQPNICRIQRSVSLDWTPTGVLSTTFDGVPVKAFAVVGSNPNGLADFQVVGHDDSTVYESSADASARSAGDLTFKRVEVTLSPRTYSTHGLDIAVRPKAGTTPSASDNLIVSRVGIDAGGNGLLLNFINFGGKTAQFFADPSAVADSYWESTVAAARNRSLLLRTGHQRLGQQDQSAVQGRRASIHCPRPGRQSLHGFSSRRGT